MKRTSRKLLVALAVVAVIIIAASIALRVIFTEEKLISLIVPRAEKALDASIELGGVRIEFPFGFGVEVERLRVSKELEEGREIHFSSESVEIKASLVSLIKRKPRLSKVQISQSDITVKMDKGKTLVVKGLSSAMSVAPEDSLYQIDIDLKVDSIMVVTDEPAEQNAVARVHFKGKIKTVFPFEKGEKRLFPPTSVDCVLGIGGLIAAGQNLPVSLDMEGSISLSGNIIASDDLVIKSGKSSSDIAFEITFDKKTQPEYLNFVQKTRIDISDLTPFLEGSAEVSGEGILLDLNGRGKIDPIAKFVKNISEGNSFNTEQIFRDFTFGGRLKVKNSSIVPSDSPVSISALNLEVDIKGGSVEEVKSDFKINGRPFSIEASFPNILPATFEVISLFGSDRAPAFSPAEFGKIFRVLRADCKISVGIAGSYIDVRQFAVDDSRSGAKAQKESKREKEISASTLSSNPLAANPITLLFLKHSDISVRLDSIVTSHAVITSLNMAGEIRNGQILLDPVRVEFADGSVESSVSVNLENLCQIQTAANIVAKNLNADKILSGFSDSESFINGSLDVKGSGIVTIVPGAVSAKSLHARCSILSRDGQVDFSRFFSPLSDALPIDLSKYERYHYDNWNGNLVISDGRVIIKDWNMKSRDGDILAGGSIGFDSTLDLTARLTIPPGTQEKMKDLRKYGDLVNLFRDDKGNLVFVFDIGGTVKSPRVALNQSRAREKAKDRVVDELKKKGVKTLKDLFKK